jgi:hypothetical protein
MDIAAVIENAEGRLTGQPRVWEMNHTDLKATHAFGADQKVRPSNRTLTEGARDNRLNYVFPRHSLTIMQLNISR